MHKNADIFLQMLVGIVETANSNKPIKTEAGQLPWACNIKKEKLKNVHLPIVHGTWNGAQNSFQWSCIGLETATFHGLSLTTHSQTFSMISTTQCTSNWETLRLMAVMAASIW
jgi:hypothetical protein